MDLDNDASEIISLLRSISLDIDRSSPVSTALLLYTLLERPGTTAHNLLGTLPFDVRARLFVESWHSANDVINPISIEHIHFASKRIAEDILPSNSIDSRHLLLTCLIGSAFLERAPERPVSDTESRLIIGWSNTAVRSLQASGIDAISFLDTVRANPPLQLPPHPEFYIFWPEKFKRKRTRIRVLRVEEVGEFYHDTAANERYPATLGLLDPSVGKELDDLLEFEELLNDPKTPELTLQKFFEDNPDFLLTDEHVAARPGFLLTGREDIGLKPDFFLQRRDVPFWDIAELKLPSAKLIRGRIGRRGLAAQVRSAIDQVHEYRDYFLDQSLSRQIQDKYGLELYWPRLTLIIGRDEAFGDYRERQRHTPPEVRLLTYDDLLRFAKHRSLLLPFGTSRAR